jgi:Holliday junction resolvase RusA-like endonuclease
VCHDKTKSNNPSSSTFQQIQTQIQTQMNQRIINSFEGPIKILKIPGDGNCLFSSISVKLYDTKPGSQQHTQKTKMLRKLASDHIIKNMPVYWENLQIVAREAFPNSKEDNNALVKKYADSLTKDGFWGGEAAIHAITNIFKTKISIIQADTPTLVFEPTGGITLNSIHLYFSGEGNTKNHYDAVIELSPRCFVENSFTTSGNIFKISTIP